MRLLLNIAFFSVGIVVGVNLHDTVIKPKNIQQPAIVWGRFGGERPFCTIDGTVWWPARDNHNCYAADNPGKP